MTIAIYSRKSKFTGKGESIANQIELCKQEARQYLSKKSITEADAKILLYEDEGFSGKNTARPEFQRMMAAIRAKEIDCVICYKLDRISRNVGDFARTYEDFEKNKVDFLCVNEKYDTTTPAGRAMMGMVSVFAQLERETTAERIRDNKQNETANAVVRGTGNAGERPFLQQSPSNPVKSYRNVLYSLRAGIEIKFR